MIVCITDGSKTICDDFMSLLIHKLRWLTKPSVITFSVVVRGGGLLNS